MLIRFWFTSLKKFFGCSKFLVSFTQWYGAKLSVIVPNKVLEPYIDSAVNMDPLYVLKSKKFYLHMALHVREEKQLKR